MAKYKSKWITISHYLTGVLKMPRARKGFLIVIEGIDGSGKTTQSKLLFDALSKKGFKISLSHEPTEGKFGKEIRKRIMHNDSARNELYELFIKDRKDHVKNKINPALNSGEIVIIDRYFISTIAYQGAAGIPINKIIRDHEQFAPMPDLIVILDLPVEEAIKRLSNKRRDSFENNINFLRKVREIYLNMKKILKANIIIIDALRPIEEIHKDILEHVLKLIKNKSGDP